MFKKLFIQLLPMLYCATTFAQSDNSSVDSIVKHVAYYKAKKSNTMMFVHLDKTVYVNNEAMWFTAYLLGVTAKNLPKHQVLATALVNNNDQTVAVQGKFIMGGGLAYGNMTIPDSIPPGHYSFIAYTNFLTNGKPEAYFVQALTLKNASQPSFNVELVLDTLYKDPANVRVMVQANAKSAPLDGAAINYFLGNDPKTRLAGKAKTNVIGSYTLLIPKDHINPNQHNLEVQVKSGADIKTLHINIPVKRQNTDVKFYPEGGHLIAGLPNRIGWEVKTPGGTAIKTSAILYAGKEILDTILTDSYGMGTFNISPVAHTEYTVRLLDVPGGDPLYSLPVAIADGIVAHVAEAIVTDTLKLQMLSKAAGRYTLLVHNYKEVYLASSFNASVQGRNIKVDLSTIPRGLQTITILDSLQRPCAERLFFAHYDQKQTLSIAVDNKEPGTCQKINLKIKLNSADGKRTQGNVSVACVQDNRFEIKNDNNIEHYVYLQSQLDNIPLKDDLMGNKEVDRRYLNELLLVRGWSKYNWPEMMQANIADTQKKQDSLQFAATVTHFTDVLKRPVQVIMMKDSTGINLFDSDSKGNVTLSNGDVYTGADKKVRLIVSGKSREYEIKVTDPYEEKNKILAKTIEPAMFEELLSQNTTEFMLNGFEHATNLKEVKIKARNDDFINGPGFNGARVNACGDYVCKNNVLNCPNHPNDYKNRLPKEGETLWQSGSLMIYGGCTTDDFPSGMLAFTGVYAAKEYYGTNHSINNSPEPDYLSTLCWKHSVYINSNNEANISFYTSDITGKFRIVVQGITNEDVVYGEDTFTVQKKTPFNK
jgi:hypothetical protein